MFVAHYWRTCGALVAQAVLAVGALLLRFRTGALVAQNGANSLKSLLRHKKKRVARVTIYSFLISVGYRCAARSRHYSLFHLVAQRRKLSATGSGKSGLPAAHIFFRSWFCGAVVAHFVAQSSSKGIG